MSPDYYRPGIVRDGRNLDVDPGREPASDGPAAATTPDALPVGWGFPGNSRKCHFFNGESFSLCGKWGFYFGRIEADTGQTGPNDCAACTKALVKLGLREAAS